MQGMYYAGGHTPGDGFLVLIGMILLAYGTFVCHVHRGLELLMVPSENPAKGTFAEQMMHGFEYILCFSGYALMSMEGAFVIIGWVKIQIGVLSPPPSPAEKENPVHPYNTRSKSCSKDRQNKIKV